jgi:hypothetical protein
LLLPPLLVVGAGGLFVLLPTPLLVLGADELVSLVLGADSFELTNVCCEEDPPAVSELTLEDVCDGAATVAGFATELFFGAFLTERFAAWCAGAAVDFERAFEVCVLAGVAASFTGDDP